MGILQAISRRIVAAAGIRLPGARRGVQPIQRRAWDASGVDRRTGAWPTMPESSAHEQRFALRQLRGRSRHLVNNNEYAARFVDLCGQNIVGANGVQMEAKGKGSDGKQDDENNAKIEEAWEAWGRKGVCTVDGMLSWEDAQQVIVECVARDGEVMVKPVVGTAAGNKFGFAIQIIEADYLDELFYETSDISGAGVFMGVEVDRTGRVVAYYLLNYNPADYGYSGSANRTRMTPDQLWHIYVPKRGHQRRGVPWMSASMLSLYQLGDFKESELTATRVAAAKMGFFEQSGEGAAPMGSDDEDDTDSPIMDVEPGTFERLPLGWKVSTVDWHHPNVAFDAFVKSCLRGSAVGVGVGYNELAGDLENVNYSSLREGRLSAIELWRRRQRWFRDWVCQPVFSRWLDMAIVTGALGIPARKADAFRYPRWVARGWDWIDPQKEAEANRVDLALGLTTRTRILAEQGDDFEDVIEELAEERGRMIALGLNPDVTLPGKSSSPGVDAGAPTDEPDVVETAPAEQQPAKPNGAAKPAPAAKPPQSAAK
jgi:lambda family phage portal protein